MLNIFLACSGLKSVKIGNGMMAIGDGSFNECGNLTEVTIDVPTPIIITSKTFSNRANVTLYVPTGCTDAYLEAEYWKEFKFIKEINETTGLHLIDNGQLKEENVYYDLNGRRVENPAHGLFIVNGKKVFVK